MVKTNSRLKLNSNRMKNWLRDMSVSTFGVDGSSKTRETSCEKETKMSVHEDKEETTDEYKRINLRTIKFNSPNSECIEEKRDTCNEVKEEITDENRGIQQEDKEKITDENRDIRQEEITDEYRGKCQGDKEETTDKNRGNHQEDKEEITDENKGSCKEDKKERTE